MTNAPATIGKHLGDISPSELDKQITIAQQTQNLANLHILVEERLSRNEAISGAARRMMLLKQAIDLNIIRENETWRLGDHNTFFAYLTMRKQEYERHGYDSEADILVVKGYSTVEAWANIVRHYHVRHGIELETLATISKSKLEVASGTCNVWDVQHDGQIDPDMFDLLLDGDVGGEEVLSLYAGRKKAQGADVVLEDERAIIDVDGVGGEEVENANYAPKDKRDIEDKEYEDDDFEDEMSVLLDTEEGFLTAWVKKGRTEVPVKFGRLDVRDDDKRDLILALCKTWRVILQ